MPFERRVPDDGVGPDRWRLEGVGLAATIVPAAGMNLVSLEVDGVDRLALPMPLAEFMTTAKTGGVPLLHPWANRLRGDRWNFDGVEVDLAGVDGLKRDSGGLPMHGLLLRESGWSVSAVGEEAVEGVLHWSKDHPCFAAFPFPHLVSVRWTVRREDGDEGVVHASCRLQVEAGEVAVPIATGWHPYLRPTPAAATDSIVLELPSARRAMLDESGLPVLGGDGRATLEPAEDVSGPIGSRRFDDLFFVGDTGWTAAVVAGEARVELEVDAAWRWMQIFTPDGSDAVCIEPMLAPTSALVDGGALRVDAGERFEAGFTIHVTTMESHR